MNYYTFQIEITGVGESPEEAWIDACDQLALDPGPCPDEYIISTEEEE